MEHEGVGGSGLSLHPPHPPDPPPRLSLVWGASLGGAEQKLGISSHKGGVKETPS